MIGAMDEASSDEEFDEEDLEDQKAGLKQLFDKIKSCFDIILPRSARKDGIVTNAEFDV